MATTLVYWRPLSLKKHTSADQYRLAAEQFVLTQQLPPVQWLEEKEEMKMPWRDRSLGIAILQLAKEDYVVVNQLSYLATSFDECMAIMEHLAQQKIYFYELQNQFCVDRQEQFAPGLNILRELDEFKKVLQDEKASLSLPQHQDNQAILEMYRDEILFLLRHGATQEFIASRYYVSTSALQNWLRQPHLHNSDFRSHNNE